jgi:hypothetical protein
MASTHHDSSWFQRGIPTRRVRSRHHGLVVLATVVPLRPESLSQDSEGERSSVMSKIAQRVASLRAQAPIRDTPPPLPSAPAPLALVPRTFAAAPDDAA